MSDIIKNHSNQLITIMIDKPDKYEFEVTPNREEACEIMASFLRNQGHMYLGKFNWYMSWDSPDSHTCVFQKSRNYK